MRYFLPDLRLSCELPPQSALADKLGGQPWGMSQEQWPKCKDCGRSQSLLAQFIHDPDRFDLGREGRVLNVFQCNHNPGMCNTWEGGSGANACFISEPEELTNQLAELPEDMPPLEREAIIIGWVENEDGIDASKESQFYSSDAYHTLPELEPEKVPYATKQGSVPQWVQSPNETPKGNWRFVAQLSDFYSFLTPPAAKHLDISEDPERWYGRTHYCDGPNFGGCGTGFIFLNSAPKPEGWFFWQC